MPTTRSCIAAGLLTAAVVMTGCGSSDLPSPATPAASTPAQSSSPSAQPSPRAGRTPGGSGTRPGGSTPEVKAVNLNTNGDSPGGANTTQVVTAAKAFLASLDDPKRDQVEYDFAENKARQTWSNLPATAVPREGIALADLTGYQQTAALEILQFALSGDGAQQDTNIRKADDYLASLGGQGAGGLGALKDYYIAIYGTPSETTPFMVQFGGHNLARNFTYNGDKVSQTPQFVGSEPTTFTVGGLTIEPLKAESSSMFAMMSALTAAQRKQAEITSGTFDDLLMGPGKDSGNFPTAEGLTVSKLNDSQRKLVLTAIKAYAGDLNTTAATKLMAKYESELDLTRIGWSNNTGPTDENSYLRIDGPSVWIEFINTRSQSTPGIDFNTVYRDKTDDYGSSKPS